MCLAGIVGILAAADPAAAQTNLTWDPNGAAAGTGGTGTWNTTTARWFNGAAHVPWSAVNFDNAIFDGTAGTVTLGVGVRAHDLTFGITGYTLSGSTLTLGGATPTITTSAGIASIGSVIAGTAGLSTAGMGTLIFTGANTYTGGTTIGAGTLQVGNGGTTGALGAGAITNNAALVINRSNAVTFAQAIGGTGTLTKLGAGTTTLTGANGYSGTTTISAGVLRVGSGGTAGTLGSGSVINNAGLAFNRSDALTVANDISGSGTVSKLAAGTTTLTGTNTYSGTTTISAGILQVGNGGTTGTLGSGAVTNNAALRINRSDAVTLGQNIAGTGTLTQVGAGTTTLTGTNTYSGVTTISAGRLQIGAGGTTGSLGTGAVTNNAALEVNRSNAVTIAQVISGTGTVTHSGTGTTTLTGANTFSGGTTISAGTLQVGNGGTTGALGAGAITNNAALVINRSNAVTFGQAIGGTGTLTNLGAGTTTLTGANSYSGTTTISAGVLRVGSGGTAGTLGTGSVINNAGLAFNRSDALTVANDISGSGTVSKLAAGTTTLTGTNTYSGTTTITTGVLQVGNGGTSGTLGSGAVTNNAALRINRSDAVTLGQNIAGTGTLTQVGAGTTTLTGTNTYSGVTTISAGRLQIGAGGTTGSLGTGAVTNNAALEVNRSNAVTIAQVISGTGTVTHSGTGTTTLTGANTFSGGTTISAGTLQVGNGGTTGALGAGAITNNAALVINRSNAVTFAQAIGGTGTLTKLGAGTTTLTGANGYSGTTTIGAGILQVGNGGTTGTLGSGAITNNAALRINRSDAVTLGQTIAGTGTFTKLGAGTTTLTGANTYAGTTTISAGVLQVGSGGTVGTLGSGSVTNNAGLIIDRSNAITVANNIAGTGTVTQSGAGTTTLTGTSTYTGATAVKAGTLRVNGSLGNTATTVESGATLGGSGSLTGGVTVNAGGRLAPGNSPGTLTVGSLNLLPGAIVDFELATPGVVGGGVNDLVEVNGNVTLDGKLNVSALGGFGIGSYRLINYVGALTNNLLDFGLMPAGFAYQLQTALAGRVSLLVGNATSGPVQYWDGSTDPVGDGVVSGGSGTWTAGPTNWTLADGSFNLGWGAQTAAFSGTAGIVTVNGPISFNGLQFQASGYKLAAGAGGVLTTSTADTPITLSPSVTATIEVPIAGSGGISVRGSGTVIFTGQNTYTGGTTIATGSTLQIGDGGTSGSIIGNVGNDGTLAFNRSDVITFGGDVSGSGALRQDGAGTLILTGTNSYTGGTTIASGATLQLGAGGTSGSIIGEVSNAGAMVFNRSDSFAFGGGISGVGEVRQEGSGTVVLSGANTYSGGTSIHAGTLSISSDGNLGTGGLVIDGATLQTTASFSSGRPTSLSARGGTFNTNSDTNFSVLGSVDGSGALTKIGGGTLTLGGFNSYSGGTRLNAGTVSISQDANLGASSGQVVFNGGTLRTTADLTSSRAVSLEGNGSIETANGSTFLLQSGISGAGTLNKSGNGRLVLTASNAYGGGTNVQAGALQLGDCSTSGSIAGDARVDGVLVFSRSDSYTHGGGISGSGAVVKDCTGTTILSGTNTYAGGTLVNTGILQGDTRSLQGDVVDNAALLFDQAFDGTFRGTLFGAGTMTKAGSGAVLLAGNHALRGRTTIQSGTLGLDGTLAGAVSVLRDGTFNAAGAVGGSLVVDGRVNVSSASAEFGVLGVAGDVTFRPESVYGVTVNSAGQSAALLANGDATVHGATVAVTAEPGTYERVTQYAVLRGLGGVSGTASATSSSPTLEPLVSQNDTTLFVTLLNRAVPLQLFAITNNGARLAGAIDRLYGRESGNLGDAARELTALDDRNLAHALDAISGEIHASAVQLAAIDGESATDAIRSEITTRMSQREGETGGGSGWGSDGWSGWLRFRGERNSFKADELAGAHGGNGFINGFSMGRDWTRSRRWLVGAGASFATGRLALNGLSDSTTFASPRGMAYAGYAGTRWAVDGGLAVARAVYETTRNLQFTALAPAGGRLLDGIDSQATSRPTGIASELWSEARIETRVGSWKVQPTAGLRRARYGLNEWREAGADSLSLSSPARAIHSLQADMGVRVSRALGGFRPFLGGTARRELTSGRTAVELNLADQANGSFEVDGLQLSKHSTIGHAGLLYRAGKVGLSVMYEARVSRNQVRQTLQLAIGFQ